MVIYKGRTTGRSYSPKRSKTPKYSRRLGKTKVWSGKGRNQGNTYYNTFYNPRQPQRRVQVRHRYYTKPRRTGVKY